MNLAILLQDDDEHSIPEAFREIFRQIIDAFLDEDFRLARHPIDGVEPIRPETARFIAETITAYGEGLAPLNDSTWNRSCYRWMDGSWDFIVDLTTEQEKVSDLSLHATARMSPELSIKVSSVHVP